MNWRDYDTVIILPMPFALAYLMDKAEVWLRAKLQRPFGIAVRKRIPGVTPQPSQNQRSPESSD